MRQDPALGTRHAGGAPRGESAVLWLAAVFPTLATGLYFVVFAGHPAMRGVYGVCKLFMLALPAAWIRWGAREPIGIPAPRKEGVALGAGFGLLIATGAFALYFLFLKSHPAFADAPRMIGAKLREIGTDTPATFCGLAAFIAVLHSGLEEYYWRWFVFGRLRRRVAQTPALLLSGLAFAAHHVIVLNVYLTPAHFWTVTVPLCLCVGIGGMAWAWLYERSRSIYGPWLSHALVDLALMGIGYDLVFGF